MIVSEIIKWSDLIQFHVKRRFDSSPETTMLLAEIQEQKSLFENIRKDGQQDGISVETQEL